MTDRKKRSAKKKKEEEVDFDHRTLREKKLVRMYHEDEGSVDVELLAECGQIAQRLRSLERTWAIELKDLQRKSLVSFGKPPLPSSQSIVQKLNEIFDINEHASPVDHKDDDDPEFVNRLRYLEDTVIKIHYQQELLSQTGGQKRTTNNKKVHIKSNMNYSTATTKNNNNDLTTSPTGIHELKDDLYETQSHSFITSDDGNSRESFNKSLLNDDVETQRDQNQANCSSNKQQQNICHQQQHLCGKITDSDIRLLIRELKRKVDFTEKMNWLCEYKNNNYGISCCSKMKERPEAVII